MDGLRGVVKWVDLGDVRLPVCNGLGCTEKAVESLSVREIYQAARSLGQPTTDIPRARTTIMRYMYTEWYRLRDEGLLSTRRKKKVKKKARRRKNGQPTGAHLIRKGLREGWDRDRIIAHVKEVLPTYRITPNHVAYYRHQLRKKGELS